MKQGNCYASSEALYHILGGKEAGWKPMRIPSRPVNHWFLKHKSGMILDPSIKQFNGYTPPDYSKSIGCGFLTKNPSKNAKKVITRLTWA